MKEIRNIWDAYQKIDFTQQQAALATVVRVEGSSYRRTGARMLVSDSGDWIGGISGGCLEGDALKKARLAMAQKRATMVTYDTTDDDPYQIGVGLGCNGIIDVLLTPLDPNDRQNPVRLLEPYLDQRRPDVLVTVVEAPAYDHTLLLGQAYRYFNDAYFRNTFPLDAVAEHNIVEDVEKCLREEKSATHTYVLRDGKAVSLFLEVILPPVHLVAMGGNYDIYPMVRLAKETGWKVSVVCNMAKVHRTLFELADAVIPKDDGDIPIDPYSAVILMAHDYETDYRHLRRMLRTNVPYIGMLGPRKRTDKMLTRAQEEGSPISAGEMERVYSPVGLDIGANTPEEIAISVIAEIRAHFAGRSGSSLRLRDKPIYEE
jgi:xanthine dehydrogenase accessory factor